MPIRQKLIFVCSLYGCVSCPTNEVQNRKKCRFLHESWLSLSSCSCRYTPLQTCIHKVPTGQSERGTLWPRRWPSRLERPPYWLKDSEVGTPNKLASKKFVDDSNFWKQVVANSYLNGIGIDWSSVRNVMDMRASYGG